MKEPTNSSEKPIIFFDGICGLCNGFVDFVIKRDKKNTYLFSTLQGETAKKNNISLADSNSVVLLFKGKKFYKSTAALKVLSNLGSLYKILVVFFLVPVFIRNYFYDFIANNRYKWFGKQECRIPDKNEREKFLP